MLEFEDVFNILEKPNLNQLDIKHLMTWSIDNINSGLEDAIEEAVINHQKQKEEKKEKEKKRELKTDCLNIKNIQFNDDDNCGYVEKPDTIYCPKPNTPAKQNQTVNPGRKLYINYIIKNKLEEYEILGSGLNALYV